MLAVFWSVAFLLLPSHAAHRREVVEELEAEMPRAAAAAAAAGARTGAAAAAGRGDGDSGGCDVDGEVAVGRIVRIL